MPFGPNRKMMTIDIYHHKKINVHTIRELVVCTYTTSFPLTVICMMQAHLKEQHKKNIFPISLLPMGLPYFLLKALIVLVPAGKCISQSYRHNFHKLLFNRHLWPGHYSTYYVHRLGVLPLNGRQILIVTLSLQGKVDQSYILSH